MKANFKALLTSQETNKLSIRVCLIFILRTRLVIEDGDPFFINK